LQVESIQFATIEEIPLTSVSTAPDFIMDVASSKSADDLAGNWIQHQQSQGIQDFKISSCYTSFLFSALHLNSCNISFFEGKKNGSLFSIKPLNASSSRSIIYPTKASSQKVANSDSSLVHLILLIFQYYDRNLRSIATSLLLSCLVFGFSGLYLGLAFFEPKYVLPVPYDITQVSEITSLVWID